MASAAADSLEAMFGRIDSRFMHNEKRLESLKSSYATLYDAVLQSLESQDLHYPGSRGKSLTAGALSTFRSKIPAIRRFFDKLTLWPESEPHQRVMNSYGRCNDKHIQDALVIANQKMELLLNSAENTKEIARSPATQDHFLQTFKNYLSKDSWIQRKENIANFFRKRKRRAVTTAVLSAGLFAAIAGYAMQGYSHKDNPGGSGPVVRQEIKAEDRYAGLRRQKADLEDKLVQIERTYDNDISAQQAKLQELNAGLAGYEKREKNPEPIIHKIRKEDRSAWVLFKRLYGENNLVGTIKKYAAINKKGPETDTMGIDDGKITGPDGIPWDTGFERGDEIIVGYEKPDPAEKTELLAQVQDSKAKLKEIKSRYQDKTTKVKKMLKGLKFQLSTWKETYSARTAKAIGFLKGGSVCYAATRTEQARPAIKGSATEIPDISDLVTEIDDEPADKPQSGSGKKTGAHSSINFYDMDKIAGLYRDGKSVEQLMNVYQPEDKPGFRKDLACKLYLEDEISVAELQKDFGNIYRILEQRGITDRRSQKNKEILRQRLDRIHDRYIARNGKPVKALAMEEGISTSTLYRYVHAAEDRKDKAVSV